MLTINENIKWKGLKNIYIFLMLVIDKLSGKIKQKYKYLFIYLFIEKIYKYKFFHQNVS